jgi:DNA polymerase-3 subunit epsilon
LCRRFDIDLSARVEHGAQIDCDLLAAVYLELLGGRQPGLDFTAPTLIAVDAARVTRVPRPHEPTIDELAAHLAMLQTITEPLWLSEG